MRDIRSDDNTLKVTLKRNENQTNIHHRHIEIDPWKMPSKACVENGK